MEVIVKHSRGISSCASRHTRGPSAKTTKVASLRQFTYCSVSMPHPANSNGYPYIVPISYSCPSLVFLISAYPIVVSVGTTKYGLANQCTNLSPAHAAQFFFMPPLFAFHTNFSFGPSLKKLFRHLECIFNWSSYARRIASHSSQFSRTLTL